MKRIALIVIGLGLVALGVWWLQQDDGEPEHAGASSSPTAASDRAQLTGSESSSETDPSAGATPPPEIDHVPGTSRTSNPKTSGSVQFEDGEKPKTFSFMVYKRQKDGSKGGWRFEGRDGVFEGPSIGPGPHEIDRVVVDGGEYAPTRLEFDLRPGVPNEIVLRRSARVRIRVVDAESGAVLSNAYALKAIGEWRIGGTESVLRMPSEFTLRGDRLRVGDDGCIELPPRVGASKWFVRAGGYAWNYVAVQHVPSSSPFDVPLVPGGDVDIVVPGWHDVDRPVLCVDVRDELPDFVYAGSSPKASERGQIRIRGLPEGPLSFFVARRGDFAIDKTYGSGRVEIVRGRSIPLNIDLETGEAVEQAPLIGTLLIPVEWGPRITSFLSLNGTQEGATAGHHAKARVVMGELGKQWAFETDPLPVGTYTAFVRGASWRVVVEHRAGREVHLVVPAPVVHRVRIVDASGVLIPGAVCKYSGTTKGVRMWVDQNAAHDAETHTHRFRVAPGDVRLRCEAPGYVKIVRTIAIEARGAETTTVELARGASVNIRFRAGDEAVSAQGFRIWASGDGMGKGFGAKGHVIAVRDVPPGTWTLKVKPVDGFEQPALTTVELDVGENKEITIELRRANK